MDESDAQKQCLQTNLALCLFPFLEKVWLLVTDGKVLLYPFEVTVVVMRLDDVFPETIDSYDFQTLTTSGQIFEVTVCEMTCELLGLDLSLAIGTRYREVQPCGCLGFIIGQ